MTATVLIATADGKTSALNVEAMQELEMPSHLRQSIHLTQLPNGNYKLVLSNGMLSGKSWESITIKKEKP